MQRSFSHIELPETAYLSCYPNASLLDIENSEFKYSDNAQYFGDVAQELINEGGDYWRMLWHNTTTHCIYQIICKRFKAC